MNSAVDVVLRRDAALARARLHFLPVLVRARQKMHLVPHLPPKPGNDVGQHLFVGVTQVGRAIHIVDGRGDIERFHAEAGQQKPPRVKCRKF